VATKFTQEKRLLELKTPLGKDEIILTSVSGTEALSRLFCYQLEIFSNNIAITPEQLIGKSVSFQINSEGKAFRYFHGFINRF